LVKNLFELPEQIRKSDFVLKLSEGIAQPEETVNTFVVTPALADAFGRALKLVDSALRDGRSQAAYLHGSFGSGKSHFMAVLSLLLEGHEAAWRKPELHPLRDKARFVDNKKPLRLHFHIVGSNSIEEAIFGRYIDQMKELHPEAPVPPLFADEQLFEDASRMLASTGTDAFFGPMNQWTAPAGDGWGDIGDAAMWTSERFELVKNSTSAKERGELFDALVKTHFTSYVTTARHAFLDLDSGLAVMASHAKQLGYDAIVLFLDELILWLAARASDSAWLNNEGQKMVKLVEAQESRRQVPIVSFIARQRDLAEMVGEDFAGAENSRLRDSLKWWEGRYDTITLEDRNLPAIVEKRVLRPKNNEAAKELDAAFERMKSAAGKSWDTMLGAQDGEAFRKLYPFSPALVEALVALSNSLQRQRTAIKLLGEILFEHIDDLNIGEVVRVGDLFDVLAGGEDTADGVMKSRFESARELYRFQLLPMIQEQHGTNSATRCQRLREDHKLRIGCSNCPEKACRSDNRLIKTLLISSLVPEVGALKDMTASRLVQLNHGTLKVPIPGTEAMTVAQTLRRWATVPGAGLHIDGQADPTVRIQLQGADIQPILDQHRDADTAGARQRVIRDLLFDAMGVEKVADWRRDHSVEWHCTKREGAILFGNVRKMGAEQLRCPEGHDWRLVIDYPFDEPGFSPNDDLDVVEKVADDGTGTWTLVWLPSFFSESINKVLGEYVVLQHILETRERTRRCVSHLSVENQSRAINELESLKSSQESRLLQVLEQAYGLASAKEGDLDSARSLDSHVHILKPGAQVQHTLAANLSDGLRSYVPALLAARYPRHPRFTHKLTKQRLGKLLERFGEIVDSDEKRVPVDRDAGGELRGTLGELGLIRVTETAAHLMEDRTLQEIENRRQQLAEDQPTVGQVRRWTDEGGKAGLTFEAADLVVRCYARWSARTLVRGGRSFEPRPGQELPEDVVLEKPPLPPQTDWKAAIDMAGETLGIALPGKALHADNLKRFETLIHQKLSTTRDQVHRLPDLVQQWNVILGVDHDSSARLTSARSAQSLFDGLQGAPGGVRQVSYLASYGPETSARAVGRSVATSEAVVRVLGDSLVQGVFKQLAAGRTRLDGAGSILDKATQTHRQDELNAPLSQLLRDLAEEAQRILAPKPSQPPGEAHEEKTFRVSATGAEAVRARLKQVFDEIDRALSDGAPEVTLEGKLLLRRPKS
jgi:hypothetical protein